MPYDKCVPFGPMVDVELRPVSKLVVYEGEACFALGRTLRSASRHTSSLQMRELASHFFEHIQLVDFFGVQSNGNASIERAADWTSVEQVRDAPMDVSAPLMVSIDNSETNLAPLDHHLLAELTDVFGIVADASVDRSLIQKQQVDVFVYFVGRDRDGAVVAHYACTTVGGHIAKLASKLQVNLPETSMFLTGQELTDLYGDFWGSDASPTADASPAAAAASSSSSTTTAFDPLEHPQLIPYAIHVTPRFPVLYARLAVAGALSLTPESVVSFITQVYCQCTYEATGRTFSRSGVAKFVNESSSRWVRAVMELDPTQLLLVTHSSPTQSAPASASATHWREENITLKSKNEDLQEKTTTLRQQLNALRTEVAVLKASMASTASSAPTVTTAKPPVAATSKPAAAAAAPPKPSARKQASKVLEKVPEKVPEPSLVDAVVAAAVAAAATAPPVASAAARKHKQSSKYPAPSLVDWPMVNVEAAAADPSPSASAADAASSSVAAAVPATSKPVPTAAAAAKPLAAAKPAPSPKAVDPYQAAVALGVSYVTSHDVRLVVLSMDPPDDLGSMINPIDAAVVKEQSLQTMNTLAICQSNGDLTPFSSLSFTHNRELTDALEPIRDCVVSFGAAALCVGKAKRHVLEAATASELVVLSGEMRAKASSSRASVRDMPGFKTLKVNEERLSQLRTFIPSPTKVAASTTIFVPVQQQTVKTLKSGFGGGAGAAQAPEDIAFPSAFAELEPDADDLPTPIQIKQIAVVGRTEAVFDDDGEACIWYFIVEAGDGKLRAIVAEDMLPRLETYTYLASLGMFAGEAGASMESADGGVSKLPTLYNGQLGSNEGNDDFAIVDAASAYPEVAYAEPLESIFPALKGASTLAAPVVDTADSEDVLPPLNWKAPAKNLIIPIVDTVADSIASMVIACTTGVPLAPDEQARDKLKEYVRDGFEASVVAAWNQLHGVDSPVNAKLRILDDRVSNGIKARTFTPAMPWTPLDLKAPRARLYEAVKKLTNNSCKPDMIFKKAIQKHGFLFRGLNDSDSVFNFVVNYARFIKKSNEDNVCAACQEAFKPTLVGGKVVFEYGFQAKCLPGIKEWIVRLLGKTGTSTSAGAPAPAPAPASSLLSSSASASAVAPISKPVPAPAPEATPESTIDAVASEDEDEEHEAADEKEAVAADEKEAVAAAAAEAAARSEEDEDEKDEAEAAAAERSEDDDDEAEEDAVVQAPLAGTKRKQSHATIATAGKQAKIITAKKAIKSKHKQSSHKKSSPKTAFGVNVNAERRNRR